MRKLTFAWLALGVFMLSSACSDDVRMKDTDTGQIDGSEDIIAPEDAADSPGTDAEDTSPDIADGGDAPDTSDATTCTPGESWCESPTVRSKCHSNTGEPYSYECSPNEVCKDGECIEGEPCEPETALGCADERSLIICNEHGNDTLTKTCPTESPECFEGQCIARLCTPGELVCKNDQVHQCDDRGLGTELVEQCAYQCADTACQFPSYSNCPSSGCEFWAVDLPAYRTPCDTDAACGLPSGSCINGFCASRNANAQQFAVFVANSTSSPLSATITTPSDSSLVVQRTVPPHDVVAIPLPNLTIFDSSISAKTYKIVTDEPATVYQMAPVAWFPGEVEIYHTADASLLLPTSGMGNEYIIPSWPAYDTGEGYSRPYATIVTTTDQTTIQVETPTAVLAGSGVSSIAAQSSQTFSLDRGQVLQLMADPSGSRLGDLTGMRISSNYPIAVYSGHEGTYLPADTVAMDHLEEQVYPLNEWGTEYVAANLASSPGVLSFNRVVASSDSTTISITPSIPGLNVPTLDEGEFIEFSTTQDFVLTSSSPVLLTQFMVGGANAPGDQGDPSLLAPSPTDSFRAQYRFFAPYGFSNNVSVVAPKGTQLHLDGQAVSSSPSTIGQTPWEVHRLQVNAGAHEVRGSNPFGLTIYGYERHVSYAYPGGLSLQ